VTISNPRTGDFLRLLPLKEISDFSYEVTASLSGHEVSYSSVSMLGVPDFLVAVRAFADTRSGQATLTGTYDFQLTLSPHGHTGAAWVGFRVVDYIFMENGAHGRHSVEGGFMVDGEYVDRMVDELSGLLSGITSV
jgi:hypothetical protein